MTNIEQRRGPDPPSTLCQPISVFAWPSFISNVSNFLTPLSLLPQPLANAATCDLSPMWGQDAPEGSPGRRQVAGYHIPGTGQSTHRSCCSFLMITFQENKFDIRNFVAYVYYLLGVSMCFSCDFAKQDKMVIFEFTGCFFLLPTYQGILNIKTS